MKKADINFFFEEVDIALSEPQQKKEWLQQIIASEGFKLVALNYILCSDEYLHHINVDRLSHDHYTDVITFDQSDREKELEGDIFISVERIMDHALQLNLTFDKELCRVMVHGVLHLMGHSDHTPQAKTRMREKEDSCLSLYSF